MMFKTLEEAQEAKLDLITRIQNIDSQLAQRAAEYTVGSSDGDYKKYLQWKSKAVRAKATLVSRLQRTKLEMIRLRQKESEERILKRANGKDKATSLLADLFTITKDLVSNGADISMQEQLVIDDVAAYLDHH